MSHLALPRIRTVLHLHPELEQPRTNWGEATGTGLSFLRTARWREAQSYYRAYPLLAVLVDLESVDDALLDELAELRRVPPETPAPAMLAIVPSALPAGQRTALAEAGLCCLLQHEDPPQFLTHHLELLQRLADLKRFEDGQSSVTALAKRTRETLHDLSQPLSAVQGRLQLLAVKCPKEDPNRQYLDDLVRQVFEITNYVIKIQQIQRDAS